MGASRRSATLEPSLLRVVHTRASAGGAMGDAAAGPSASSASAVSSLPPIVPPLRFALVEDGVYRGAYPSLINLRFLKRLGLRSMVSLLPEAPVPHLLAWCEANGVRHHFERVAVFKEEVTLSPERTAELLQLLVLPERQPVLVHCLDGVSVTGTLVMCLRKLQRWTPPPLVAEYARFARGGAEVPTPPPDHVLAFVASFKPEVEFAKLVPERVPPWLEAALEPAADERGGGGAAAGECCAAAASMPRLPRVGG